MARQILLHEDFLRDARRHEEWLVRNGREEWLANLLVGIEEIADLLRRYPAIGQMVMQNERIVLRSFPFRRYPYLIWFAYRRHRPIGDVWLVRLFGAAQDRSKPGSLELPDEDRR